MNAVENYLPRQQPSIDLESRARDVNTKRKSFQDSMVDLLVNDSVYRKGTQFVLKGMPSSGKSTELRRLASTLAGHLRGRGSQLRTLVHLHRFKISNQRSNNPLCRSTVGFIV